MVMLGAYVTSLHRYTGQDDIVVGTDVANRNCVELEGLIGFFVNQLVMRTDASGNPTFKELLRRVRDVTIGAYMHQDLPFDRLVQGLNPSRDLSRSPLFQVMLILQNAPAEVLEFSDLTMSSMENGDGTAKFDLTLSFVERNDQLYGFMEYNHALVDADDRADARHRVCSGSISESNRRISDYRFMDDAERRNLLGMGMTTGRRSRTHCVTQRFETGGAHTDAVDSNRNSR